MLPFLEIRVKSLLPVSPCGSRPFTTLICRCGGGGFGETRTRGNDGGGGGVSVGGDPFLAVNTITSACVREGLIWVRVGGHES